MSRPDRATELFVRRRAGNRCEYCHLSEANADVPFQTDHVIAEKHRGPTTAENLAYACFYCNTYKGPNLAGVDPNTRKIVRLFNPRLDHWNQHFTWDGAILRGQTAIGRATIDVLRINLPTAIAAREALRSESELD